MALNRRITASALTTSVVALMVTAISLAGGTAEAAEPDGGGPIVSATYSSSDQSLTLDEGDPLQFEPIDGSGGTTIGVNTAQTGQTLDGLGGSLESSSVYNIAQLSTGNRDAVMNALFDPQTGNGYDLMRLSFGCPDFCSQAFYTYDDVPAGDTDTDLSEFSIQKDVDSQIVSVAQQAIRINPDVEFFASAWSPPAWMKDNQSLNNGGSVKPEYYPVLAQYYRLAIQAYADQGIPIKALTVNNEPLVAPDYPSAAWSWEQERDFIPFLRTELDAHALSTEIWIQDDNWWTTSQFANILADPVVGPMVDGVAVHDYDDGDVTQAAALVDQYPDVTVRLTERSYYDVKGIDRMIQLFRNDVSSWTYWLTFLDEDGLPNEGPLDGDSFPQQIGAPNGDLDSWYLDRDYYLYGQFSRFLERGAVRVESDYGSTDTVTDVVFRNPDGSLVAIVDNQTDYSQHFRLVTPDGQVSDTLPAAAVGTYTWTPERVAMDRGAWAASANTQDWGSSQMLDNDQGTAWRNFSAQAPGQAITIDTGAVQPLSQITLDQGDLENGSSANDWPRGYAVTTSADGVTWSDPVATGRGTKRLTNIRFDTTDARYVRVELTAVAASSYWSVAEVFAFAGDEVKPVVSVTLNPGYPDGTDGWYTGSVTATAAATDETDPAPAVEVSIDGGAWAAYASAVELSTDGEHSVAARATDSSGNVSDPVTAAARIDATAPVATAVVDPLSGSVTLSAEDPASGIGVLEYLTGPPDSSEWVSYETPVALVDGESLSFRARDRAGNVSEAQTVTWNADATATPTPSATATPALPASGSGSLASTGLPLLGGVLAAAGLLLGGVVLLRRRGSHA